MRFLKFVKEKNLFIVYSQRKTGGGRRERRETGERRERWGRQGSWGDGSSGGGGGGGGALQAKIKIFSKIFSPSHIKLANNKPNKDFKSVKRP